MKERWLKNQSWLKDETYEEYEIYIFMYTNYRLLLFSQLIYIIVLGLELFMIKHDKRYICLWNVCDYIVKL